MRSAALGRPARGWVCLVAAMELRATAGGGVLGLLQDRQRPQRAFVRGRKRRSSAGQPEGDPA